MGKSFGILLKELREARGYSMNQLAKKTGINVAHISRLERNKRHPPKIETIIKLANVLGNYGAFLVVAGYIKSVNYDKAFDLNALSGEWTSRRGEVIALKLYEKYRWYPVAYKDKPVEECAPAFLGFIETMNELIEAIKARKQEKMQKSAG